MLTLERQMLKRSTLMDGSRLGAHCALFFAPAILLAIALGCSSPSADGQEARDSLVAVGVARRAGAFTLTVDDVRDSVVLPGDLGFRSLEPGGRYLALDVTITNSTEVDQPFTLQRINVVDVYGKHLNYMVYPADIVTPRPWLRAEAHQTTIYVEVPPAVVAHALQFDADGKRDPTMFALSRPAP